MKKRELRKLEKKVKEKYLENAIEALKKSLENIKNDEINFQKKKITDFDESQAEILTSRFIQKITTQFVKHLKDENTSVSESIDVIQKVFQS